MGSSLTRLVRESVWSYVWYGVYITRPVLTSVSSFDGCGVSIARPRFGICLVARRVGNFSYTPRASMSCFRFVRVSLTHRVMESVGLFGGWGVSLKRPVLESV